jgi:hypothetical protein
VSIRVHPWFNCRFLRIITTSLDQQAVIARSAAPKQSSWMA